MQREVHSFFLESDILSSSQEWLQTFIDGSEDRNRLEWFGQ
jgi:hypothetical protein